MNYIARGCMYCEGTCNKECLPKKETVDEAAERIYPTPNPYIMGIDLGNSMRREAFKEGAKWIQERMYSEDEVIEIVEKSRLTGLTTQYLMLTEQFKKK
jgi:hypothetical protein